MHLRLHRAMAHSHLHVLPCWACRPHIIAEGLQSSAYLPTTSEQGTARQVLPAVNTPENEWTTLHLAPLPGHEASLAWAVQAAQMCQQLHTQPDPTGIHTPWHLLVWSCPAGTWPLQTLRQHAKAFSACMLVSRWRHRSVRLHQGAAGDAAAAYAILRAFSWQLRLSPVPFGELCAALVSAQTTPLLDDVHVCVLRALVCPSACLFACCGVQLSM